MKGPNLTRLFFKKMRRTVFRSPLQFLAMVLILALGSTLFSGLYASHLAFSDQVNRIYEITNVADVWSKTYYDSDKDPKQESLDDLKMIQDLIGENGKVETQYQSSARINGVDNYAFITDQYPTIHVPYNTYFEKESNDDFFIYDAGLMSDNSTYGGRDKWLDDNGHFYEATFELEINSFKDKLEDKNHNLMVIFDEFINPNETNIFNNDRLLMRGTPTGYMRHVEGILPNNTLAHTFLMSRKFLITSLANAVNKSFDKQKLEEAIAMESDPTRLEKLNECLNIIEHPEVEIMERYWPNNRFLTRLNNRNEGTIYRAKIENAFKSKTDSNLILNLGLMDTNTHKQLNTDILQSLQLCYVFPPLFFLVAVLVVLTTLSQIILKERGDIGTLKALGSSNKSIFAYYLSLTGLISLFGVAIGLVVGPLLLPNILNLKYDMLYNLPGPQYIFPTTIAIVMTLVVLATTMLVSYLIARKEVKSLPVVSMRPKTVKIKNKIKNEKMSSNTHQLCLRMAIRNIFCASTRSLMVIIGVLGCAGLLTCGFSIDDSIETSINHDVSRFFNTDVLIYLSNPTQETVDQFNDLQDKGVITTYEPYGYLPSTCFRSGYINSTYATNVYSINPYSERTNKFFDIGYEVHNENIAITNKVAKNLNLKEGDILNFTFVGKTYSGKIGKIVDAFYLHGVFIDGTSSKFPMVTEYPTCAYARFNKDLDSDKVIEQIKEIPGVGNIINEDSLKNTITDISSSISYITTTIKIFAILLAVVVLYNLALLNFNENVRNIATMKVLGFNRREVAESLFFEIMILSAIGILIGLALGYPLARLTLGINQVPMCEFFYSLSAGSVFLSLLIALGVSAIVNVYLGLKNRKVKMVESLKSIE